VWLLHWTLPNLITFLLVILNWSSRILMGYSS
jgi:hypothetical protein